MPPMYYLLSSSGGYPISKCCSDSREADPQWKSIARLISFIYNIFAKEEEIQFSNGDYTFFSLPQSTSTGAIYFVTLFTVEGTSRDFSSLSRYVGYATRVLFQEKLGECLSYLEIQASALVQNSTYRDTINGTDASGDCDDQNPDSELFDEFPTLMEALGVFEEHFIPELFLNTVDLCRNWFNPILSYCIGSTAAVESCTDLICCLFYIGDDKMLYPLVSCPEPGRKSETVLTLETALIEYSKLSPLCNNQNTSSSQGDHNVDHLIQSSRVLKIQSQKNSSHIGCDDETFYTVSHVNHVSQRLL